MPHVLTLVEQFWHKVPGGTAKATERTVAALLDRDEFSITGLAARHRPAPSGAESTDFGAARVPRGCDIVYSRLPRPALYESWLRFGRPSVDGAMRPDSVFWASSLIVPPTSRPVVSTIHDLDFLGRPDFLTRRGREFFPRMWAVAKKQSDLFVCPSEVVAEQARGHGVSSARIIVVPWGVEAPLVDADRAGELLASLGLSDGYVLLVAPDQPRKNPEGCAAALRQIDCSVVIVGSDGGSDDVFAPLGSRVRRLGAVTDAELSALYRGARVLLFPSHAEGFGLPVLEAMAHGTPVVTSRGTATEEVAGGAARLVDSTNSAEIADAVEELLTDQGQRHRLVADGLTRAAQQTWANTAKGYSEAFLSVL